MSTSVTDVPPVILVVDDDELSREVAVSLIESFGYSVTAAASGIDAMRVIAETPSIALVFTDIAMPGVGGIVLADMVKRHRPSMQILYTTGGMPVDRVRSEAGILHGNILRKPYRSEELRREIVRIFSPPQNL